MTAKVKAAIQAAEAGIFVVIKRYNSSFNSCFIIQKNRKDVFSIFKNPMFANPGIMAN